MTGKVYETYEPIDLIKKPGSTGKNWIALPLETSMTFADVLMPDIGNTCEAVNKWNTEEQKFEGWLSNGMGKNFPLFSTEGYEVHVDANTTLRWRVDGASGSGYHYVCEIANGEDQDYNASNVITSTSQIIEISFGIDTGNQASVRTNGWYFPDTV